MRAPLSLARLALVTGIAFGGAPPEAARAQAVACNPSTNVPSYSYQEVFDSVDASSFSIAPRMNDLGDVAIWVQVGNQGGPNSSCLAYHSGIETRTVLCTQSVDAGSDVSSLTPPLDLNRRGRVVIGGLKAGSSLSRVLVVPRTGPHLFSEFEGYPREIDDAGNVAYVSPLSLSLVGAFSGFGGFAALAAPGLYDDGFFASGSGHVLYFAGSTLVGRISNTFAGGIPPIESEASPGSVTRIDRTGGFAYYDFGFQQIFRRLSPFGGDVLVADQDDPASPVFGEAAKLGCSVALLGGARGVCRGGTRDREFCDPFPPGGGNECAATGGFCESGVRGLFLWQGGPTVPLLLEGDPLFGSTIQSFITDTLLPPLHIEGNLAGQILFGVKLADGRDLLVRGDPAGASASAPSGPTACGGAACTFELQPSGFSGVGASGVPIYVSFGGVASPDGGAAEDEALTGFDYAVGPGAPRFAGVQVPFPLSNGQEAFVLEVGAASFPIVAGEQFDLTAVDLDGVAAFSLRGIETGEPVDPEEVVTGVTFVAEAPVELTITAVVVPEAGAAAASSAALLALAALARRRRSA